MENNRSYMCTPISDPYIYQTFPDRLRQLADTDPNREAFVFYNNNNERETLSRKEVLEKSLNLARHFVKLGLKKGTNVAICMNNSLESLLSTYGMICAGGIPIYIPTVLKDGSDLIEILNNLKCEFFIIDTSEGDDNWRIIDSIWKMSENESSTVPSLKVIVCNGKSFRETSSRLCLSSLLEMSLDQDLFVLPKIYPEDVLAYLGTSGSTGTPKVVVYTHFSVLNWSRQSNKAFRIDGNSRFFCERSFGWAVGYPRTYVTEGATRIFVDIRVSLSGKKIDVLCDIIEKEKCDSMFVPGYILADLQANQHLAEKFKTVKSIIVGGERVKASVTSITGTFCEHVYTFYGNTEAGGGFSFGIVAGKGDFEEGIIGKPLPGVEMKICDANGDVVPVGASGELCTRSVWRFCGYLMDEKLFRESVDDKNWFHTGDIAHIRSDGQIVVQGRNRELISMMTMKFFPWQIEKDLKNIPGAALAFAVGVPDKRLGEVVCACVLPAPDSNMTVKDIETFCNETFFEESTAMGLGLRPKYHIILEKVPLTISGKIARMQIAEIARKQLGL